MFAKIWKAIKIYVFRDKFLLAHRKWINDKGDRKFRYEYLLNKDSIVFDLGGYHGEFTEKIFDKYGCTIYVFEPVKEYFNMIEEKFTNNSKVKVFNFGLSNKDEKIEIVLSNDGSSTFLEKGKKETIYLRSIIDFLVANKIVEIDLFKINIEGGEFDVLPALIDNNRVKSIKNLQIQFHTFIPDAIKKREAIRQEFLKTHQLTYDYYFIWENWTHNENS